LQTNHDLAKATIKRKAQPKHKLAA
jgi:hypothetical protein